ncbi:MAG: transcription-repair coupling factor, partial [Frankiales bacterium]|nr:transcription-repair coupling factor [Frankiales bacterium]
MSLAGLLDAALADPALRAAVAAAGTETFAISGPTGLQPLAIAALAERAGRTVLAVTSSGREAEDLLESLRSLMPADSLALYPGWETLPHERLSPRPDTVGRRIAVLRRLRHPSAEDASVGPLKVVIAPVRAILQPQAPGLGDLEPVRLAAGDTGRELSDVVTALANAGYARTELVANRGDFAVRGGILDIFPPTEEHPLRVEFWGDEVEEIRYFAVADQRSLAIAEHGLWAAPCREMLL